MIQIVKKESDSGFNSKMVELDWQKELHEKLNPGVNETIVTTVKEKVLLELQGVICRWWNRVTGSDRFKKANTRAIEQSRKEHEQFLVRCCGVKSLSSNRRKREKGNATDPTAEVDTDYNMNFMLFAENNQFDKVSSVCLFERLGDNYM